MTNIPVLLMQLSSAERISIVFLFRGQTKLYLSVQNEITNTLSSPSLSSLLREPKKRSLVMFQIYLYV